MTGLRILCFLFIAGILPAAEAPPDAATVEKLLATMRDAAKAYDSKLPDFICTQITRRETRREVEQIGGVRTSGRGGASIPGAGGSDGNWKALDSIEQQLTYFGHKETYKVVAVNGRPVKSDKAADTGMTSSGEFGSTLGGIFDTLSHAEFKWDRWDKLRGVPVYVFSYSITKENSNAMLSAGPARVVAAYHGLIFVDREAGTIARVTTAADVPPDFPLQNVTHVLDYGIATIAGERFLLPLRSEMESRATKEFVDNGRIGGSSPLVTFRNTIDFKGYRKYGVESVVRPE
jgi:hypothetical protein